ncbi:MAG: Hsp33 family molecular chaperone HslO [bacterium]|nr:Hsp33 family molecular chaperone HslO [bacterium]
MIKKKLEGKSKKELLVARSKDKLYRFLLEDGQIRGAIVHATHMVNEMRANHELGILETLALGHAYIGASLLSANLKGNDRMAFSIECDGPLKGLSVEFNAYGEVRGYLKNVPIPLDKPLESFDLTPFMGAGFLRVTKYPEAAKEPYTGHVKLQHGSIALNLANYYLTSEQTSSAFNLSIKFDNNGVVTGAGGLFLQAMPDAEPALVETLENAVNNLPSIGDEFARGKDPESFVKESLFEFSPALLGNRRVEFYCRCKKEATGRMIAALPPDNLKDVLENGPFPLETRCHNCNTLYSFEKVELEALVVKDS